ncbi:MAG TPA: FAD-dependent oxidoreductase, partial [Firmicutes bacterium]|nr:FAD-dependent oxidoreductase [Bacillota bacterium]
GNMRQPEFSSLKVPAETWIKSTFPSIILANSTAEFMPGGYGLREAVEFAKMIDGKVDLIHVSAGTFKDENSGCRMFPSAFLPRGVNTYLAAAIKKAVKTPVATVGGLNDPAHMEALIADGEADVIAVGRQILADPYFPAKIRRGEVEKVRPCIRCNHCLSLDYVPYVSLPSGISQCTVNPVIGREFRESLYRPRPAAKLVLVAGGGPGGMQAALSAAKEGHSVILAEKSPRLGGLLNSWVIDAPFKADLADFRDYLIKAVAREPLIEIRLNTAVTPALVNEIKPDTLICAVGGLPHVPDLPGTELEFVHQAAQLNGEVDLGQKAVIIGGGITGCEVGLNLAKQGIRTTILEKGNSPAPGTPILHFKALLLEFAAQRENLRLLTNSKATKIDAAGVYYTSPKGEKKHLPADSVILAVGMRPNFNEVEKLRAAGAKNFVVIGDSLKEGKILQAVHGGYFAGKNA